MTLKEYRQKRRSGRSPEPRGRRTRGSRRQPHFVIQHHAASTDHYDFRLEIDGVLVSWAVPKGPSTNPKDMAEDLKRGHLSFRLDGDKLRGGYALTRFRTGKDEGWLLVKKSEEDADARRKPVRSQPESVLSGRTLDELS
jgi:hypothetical protein